MVRLGIWLWAMSNFQRMPTQDEVLAYDPRWVSDMQLAYTIMRYTQNRSPLMAGANQWRATRQRDPDG